EEFDDLFEAAKRLADTTSDAEVPPDLLRRLVASYKGIVRKHTRKAFPQEPGDQLKGAIEAVFRSWNGPRAIAYRNRERISDEQGKLWMLQTRVGKRTGAAALRMAVEMTRDRKIKLSKAEAVQRVTADHLDSVLHPQFAGTEIKVIATGLAASPGAAVGKAYFT